MSDQVGDQYNLKFGNNAGASVDAYLEYKRIVGDDDGGQMFTPAEYEKYKKKVLPQRMLNRLYTSWTSPTGMDCKLVGPETPCFCTHRYRQHKTDFEVLPSEKPVKLPCKVRGCPCSTFLFIPMNGGQPIRCSCKHLPEDHSVVRPYKCKREICRCMTFKSSFTCGCGHPTYAHKMLCETREEREARGHPVGMNTPYQAMGGITGFSSLLEGYQRLDPSGQGAPDEEFLNQPITASDNPFLRSNLESIRAHKMALADNPDMMKIMEEDDLAERMSAMRRPGESELDYYERRYQERQKAERMQKRGLPENKPKKIGQRKAPTKSVMAPPGAEYYSDIPDPKPKSASSRKSKSKSAGKKDDGKKQEAFFVQF